MESDNTPNGSSIYTGVLSFNSHTHSTVFIEIYVINKCSVLHCLCARVIRVISGHSRLKDHMHKINLAENPCCSCSEARQTVRHIIMDCPTLSVQRQIMIDNIDEAYSEHQIPLVDRVINFSTLLTSFQCDSKIKFSILKAVIKFLDSVTYEI